MSLSEDLRNELAAIAPRRECDRLAELSGLAHAAGSVHLRGRGDVALHLDVASPSVARRAFSLLGGFGVRTEIRTYRQRAFGRATRYQLHVEGRGRVLQVLNEAGILDGRLAPLERPPKRVVARSCCRAAYLRGALLGAGSLSGPRDLHLELRTATVDGAEFLAELAGRESVRLRVVDRGRHAVAYAKGAEPVGDMLAAVGASGSVLALHERAVVAATRSRANRLANADHANLVRSSRAAHGQLQALRRLDLEHLSPKLREIAELRLANPTLSIRELGLKCRPPASKATAYRRLRALARIAER